ncbi:lymphocyte-specific protein 1 isoform 8 [Mus musculus]|nr:lymphocyte-specific protein 1 isoform 8 [Mus musculus]NP_001399602.1 lymphocyte-specific protein 1 isoform 8 [Mus musculus]
MAVASTKTLWETGEVQSQSASKTPSCQSTPSGKRYKFVATGHGKYEKVLVDEGSAP